MVLVCSQLGLPELEVLGLGVGVLCSRVGAGVEEGMECRPGLKRTLEEEER